LCIGEVFAYGISVSVSFFFEFSEETSEPSRCNSVPLVKKEDMSTYKRAHSIESYKYKRPDAVICAESVEIECLMHRAQFFLARACEENIKLAMETSLWTTHPFVEKLLAEAYRRAPVVILVFLARNADHFAGFARMCSEALYRSQPAMRWVDFKGGGNIKLQWITKCPLALSASDHIKNPFNKGTIYFFNIISIKKPIFEMFCFTAVVVLSIPDVNFFGL
uniref:YTH domain-containing protein n=1 Tax=Brugia timori TaxID=42155 RepID=A0A0R3QHQ3_9BILA